MPGRSSIWCATSRQLEGHGGVYCEDADIARIATAADAGERGVQPWAIAPDTAEQLWAVSEAATGVRFPL